MASLSKISAISTRRNDRAVEDIAIGSISFNGLITQRRNAVLSGQLWRAEPQDVVFSKIDIRNGAVGVVGDSTGALAFTSEFPIYNIRDSGSIRAEFMQLLCRTVAFRSQVEARVVGHSGRRRLPPEVFEGLEVPVPLLEQQDQILMELHSRRARSEATRAMALPLVGKAASNLLDELGILVPEFEAVEGGFQINRSKLRRWSARAGMAAKQGVVQEISSARPLSNLGDPDLATVSYGLTKSPANRPGDFPRAYLRVANVQDGFLDLRDVKYIDVPDEQMPRYLLEPGDLLICEGNSKELVGRPALWNGELSGCVHQNHILRVRVNRSRLLPAFVFAYMHGKAGRWYFGDRAKQTTNLATINSTDVKQMPIPVPDLIEQERLAGYVSDAMSEAGKLAAASIDQDAETDRWLADRLGSPLALDVEENLADGEDV